MKYLMRQYLKTHKADVIAQSRGELAMLKIDIESKNVKNLFKKALSLVANAYKSVMSFLF